MTIVSSLKLLEINRTPAFYIHQYGSKALWGKNKFEVNSLRFFSFSNFESLKWHNNVKICLKYIFMPIAKSGASLRMIIGRLRVPKFLIKVPFGSTWFLREKDTSGLQAISGFLTGHHETDGASVLLIDKVSR